MWFRFKSNKQKDKDNKQVNLASQKNNVKGGINITTTPGPSPFEQLMISKLENIENKLDKHAEAIRNNAESIYRLSKGLNIYVQNNGVEPKVKKIVSDILENKSSN